MEGSRLEYEAGCQNGKKSFLRKVDILGDVPIGGLYSHGS